MPDHNENANKHVLLAILGLMALIGAIGLIIALPLVGNYDVLRADLRTVVLGILGAFVAGLLIYLVKAYLEALTARQKSLTNNEKLDTPTGALQQLPATSGPAKVGIRTFIADFDLGEVVAVDAIAITGELEVCTLCAILERTEELRNRRVHARILLRADSSSDSRRIGRRGATRQALNRVHMAHHGFTYEIRYYSAVSPLRAVMLHHEDDTRSGHLSFYDWRTDDLMSVREAEVQWCYVRNHVSASDELFSVYESWFAHFWGRHKIHTLLFDFDDTLFQTRDIQVRAWLQALQSAYENGVISKNSIATDVCATLPDTNQLYNLLTDILVKEQQESGMINRVFPQGLNDQSLESLRTSRLKIRDAATGEQAVPFHEITRHLTELRKEYQLVIVSATSEEPIRKALERYDLSSCFSYIFGKEALHSWIDIEGKTPTFIRASNMIGVPLERMAFIGDSDPDFRAARQLGMKFIESRLNARSIKRESFVTSRKSEDDLFFVDTDERHDLLTAIDQVERSLDR